MVSCDTVDAGLVDLNIHILEFLIMPKVKYMAGYFAKETMWKAQRTLVAEKENETWIYIIRALDDLLSDSLLHNVQIFTSAVKHSGSFNSRNSYQKRPKFSSANWLGRRI